MPEKSFRVRTFLFLFIIASSILFLTVPLCASSADNQKAAALDERIALTIPDEGANGVLLSSGSWFGGWSFYFDAGRPVVHHAYSQQPDDQFVVASKTVLPAGVSDIRYAFTYDGGGRGKGGEMQIIHNGTILTRGRIEKQITVVSGLGETFDTGRDTGGTVVTEGAGTKPYNGIIHKIEVIPGRMKLQPVNHKKNKNINVKGNQQPW